MLDIIKNKAYTLNSINIFELRIYFSLQNFLKISGRIYFLKIIFEFEKLFLKHFRKV